MSFFHERSNSCCHLFLSTPRRARMQLIHSPQMEGFYGGEDGKSTFCVPSWHIVEVASVFCLYVVKGWLSASNNKAQPHNANLHIVFASQKGQSPDPVSGFAHWLLVASGSSDKLMFPGTSTFDGTWYFPNLWVVLLERQSPARPHPCAVCRHWLIMQIIFFFLMP